MQTYSEVEARLALSGSIQEACDHQFVVTPMHCMHMSWEKPLPVAMVTRLDAPARRTVNAFALVLHGLVARW